MLKYISMHTKLVLLIGQVYQHQLTQNEHSTWTHIPVIQYFWPDNFPYSHHQALLIYGLKVFPRPMDREKYCFLSAVPWIDHYFSTNLNLKTITSMKILDNTKSSPIWRWQILLWWESELKNYSMKLVLERVCTHFDWYIECVNSIILWNIVRTS